MDLAFSAQITTMVVWSRKTI